MGSYCTETYGCQMNLADSELIAGILEADGWVRAPGPDVADVVIINTCSVRGRAVERVVGRVQSMRPLKRSNRRLRIVLAGCLPQHLGQSLADRLPEVDLFVGPDAYRRLPELLKGKLESEHLVLARDRRETYDGLRPLRCRGVHAWVPIMRGCDRACTYCAVPLARGRERSLGAESVLQTVRETVSEGFVAVTLLGQAVTSYRDGDRDFAWLLDRLADTEGLIKLRFLAPHPADFTPQLLDVIRHYPTIARHLHLPLQSGSDRILKAMRRGYTRASYLHLVQQVRAVLPGAGITTDLIVGFPGETGEDFRQTTDLMKAVRFDSAFMFAYSPRERTPAARFLSDDVPGQEKQKRLAEVIALQDKHSRERFSAAVGTVREVLVEGPAKGSPELLFGRCDDHKPAVFAPRPGPMPPPPGRPVRVRITQASSHTLSGEQVG